MIYNHRRVTYHLIFLGGPVNYMYMYVTTCYICYIEACRVDLSIYMSSCIRFNEPHK